MFRTRVRPWGHCQVLSRLTVCPSRNREWNRTCLGWEQKLEKGIETRSTQSQWSASGSWAKKNHKSSLIHSFIHPSPLLESLAWCIHKLNTSIIKIMHQVQNAHGPTERRANQQSSSFFVFPPKYCSFQGNKLMVGFHFSLSFSLSLLPCLPLSLFFFSWIYTGGDSQFLAINQHLDRQELWYC